MQEEIAGQKDWKIHKKAFSKLGWRFLLGTLAIYAIQIICILAVSAVAEDRLDNPNINMMVSILPMYLLGIPALAALLWKLPHTKPKEHAMGVGQLLTAVVMGYAILYCSNLLGTMITSAFSVIKGSEVENVMVNVTSSVHPLLLFIWVVCCAPVIEEFIFRKLLVDRTLAYGQGIAVVMSGLMFALFHGNLNQFVYAFTMGCALAFLYVKTGRLRYTIIIHAIVNFVGSILSTWIIQLVPFDELANAKNEEEMAAVISGYMGGFFIYLTYIMLLLLVVVVGVVLLIKYRKEIRFDRGSIELPKGRRFQIIICNPGMIGYLLFWIVMIILQLFE